MQVGCQRGGDSGFVVRDWLANGDLSCLVLHSLSLSLSLSLCSCLLCTSKENDSFPEGERKPCT